MRTLLAALLVGACLLLSGCAAPGGNGTKDDDPGAGDPPGPGPGPAPEPTPGPGFAPQSGFAETRDAGLYLSATMKACESGFCLHGLTKNEGQTTFHVSNICVSPFSDKMASEGRPVQPREPTPHCEAFGTSPFAPGASLEADVTWDSRLWNEEVQKMEDAPQGAYAWTLAFEAYEHANGGDRVVLEATIQVIVGET